jgi:hypothetical protein
MLKVGYSATIDIGDRTAGSTVGPSAEVNDRFVERALEVFDMTAGKRESDCAADGDWGD